MLFLLIFIISTAANRTYYWNPELFLVLEEEIQPLITINSNLSFSKPLEVRNFPEVWKKSIGFELIVLQMTAISSRIPTNFNALRMKKQAEMIVLRKSINFIPSATKPQPLMTSITIMSSWMELLSLNYITRLAILTIYFYLFLLHIVKIEDFVDEDTTGSTDEYTWDDGLCNANSVHSEDFQGEIMYLYTMKSTLPTIPEEPEISDSDC